MKNLRQNRGLIKTVLLIVIALVVLGFFGYNLREIADSPTVRDNLSYVWGLLTKLWDNFLAKPAAWIWNTIVIDLIWHNLQGLLGRN
ncbi:MAG: hypothetical protein Greene041679_79 [Parcubacteria group bacterium Greene0416_79]|nr:MAG: hypothetical protein Greene041679_79 [Parcubacteria group bacterium Greene0416_79]